MSALKFRYHSAAKPPDVKSGWIVEEGEQYSLRVPYRIRDSEGSVIVRVDGEPFARSGYAEVYKYTRSRDGAVFAMKVLQFTENGTSQYEREKTLAGIAQPSSLMVPIAFIDSHQIAVMPLMDGTLEDLLKTKPSDISGVAMFLLAAIDKIHTTTGLMFSDIHCGNIMYWTTTDADGRRASIRFYLIDYGALCTDDDEECAIMYTPDVDGISHESKVVFAWLCTVLIIAGFVKADNLCQNRKQLKRCDSNVIEYINGMRENNPKLAGILAVVVGEDVMKGGGVGPYGAWIGRLSIKGAISAFKTQQLGVRWANINDDRTRKIEKKPVDPLELRIEFTLNEIEQFKAAIEHDTHMLTILDKDSIDYKEVSNMLLWRFRNMEKRHGELKTLQDRLVTRNQNHE